MAFFETITKKETSFEDTVDMKKIISKRVLANTGLVVGKISQIRFDSTAKLVEGIVTKNFTHKPLYIGASYIDKMTPAGIVLNIEPSVFLKNRKIISYEGKVLGRASKVNRKGNRNEVESVVLTSFMKRKKEIPFSAIAKLGKSIILKKDYDVKQKYIWQGSN